jgi:PST family polysaccharide transporter
MGIVRAGAFSAVAAAARLLSGLVVIKLVALFVGPEGVAQLGQFISLMSLLLVFAGGGIGTGIVKYTAEYQGDHERLDRLLNAGLYYTLITSCLTGIAVLIFSKPLTLWLLGDIRYKSLIWILAIAQSLIAIHNYIVAIINGFMDVRRITLIHVIGSLVSLVLTALLAYFFRLYGALLALVLGQAMLLVVSLHFFRHSSYFDWKFFRPHFDRYKISLLLKFSLMTMISALLSPLVQIWVRNHLAKEFSWKEVGYWQAVSKVSDAYLLFITMAINVYYLPKLSLIKDRTQFRAELSNAYRFIVPVVIVLAVAIFTLRKWVTLILFNEDFIDASYLYAPQLIGDVLKISSYIFAYVMLAKAMTRTFLLSELAFSMMYVGWVWILTLKFGLIGSMYAFAVNYLLYFGFTFVVVDRYIKTMEETL